MQTRISQLLEAVSELWGSRSAKGAELQLGIVFKLLNAPGLTQRLAAIDVLRDLAMRLAADPPAANPAQVEESSQADVTAESDEDTSFGLHSLAGWLSSHKVQFIAGLTGRNMHSKCLERARGLITVLARHGEVDDPSLDQLWTVVSKAHDAADEARPIYDMVATIVENAPVGQALSLLDRVWVGADEEFTKSAALVARLSECKRAEEVDDHLVQSSLISLAWRVLFHPAAPVDAGNAGPLHPRTRRRRSPDETARVLKYLMKTGHLMLMASLRLSQTRLCIQLPKDIVLQLQTPVECAKATHCISQEHDALSSIMLACLAVIRHETQRLRSKLGGSERSVRDISVRALDLLAQGFRFAHFLCERPAEDIFQLSIFERLMVVEHDTNSHDGQSAGPPSTGDEPSETAAPHEPPPVEEAQALLDRAPAPPAPRATPPEGTEGERVSIMLAFADALHGVKDAVLQNLHAFGLHRALPPLQSLRVRCAFLYTLMRHAPSMLMHTDEIIDLWTGSLSRSLAGRHATHELIRRISGGGLLDMVVLIQESYGTTKESARTAWQDCKHHVNDGPIEAESSSVLGDLFEPIQQRDACSGDDDAEHLEDPSEQLLWTGLHYESCLEHAGAFRSLGSTLLGNVMDNRPARPSRYGSLESTACLHDRETYRPVSADSLPFSVFTQRDVLLLEGQMLQLFLFFFDPTSSAFKPALFTSEALALFQIMFIKLNSASYVFRCGKRTALGGTPSKGSPEPEHSALEQHMQRTQDRLSYQGGGVLVQLQVEGSSPRLLSSHSFPALRQSAGEFRLEDQWADVTAPGASRVIGGDSLLAIALQAPPPIAKAAGDLLVGLHTVLVRQATELVAYAYVDALEQLSASEETTRSPMDMSGDLWRRIAGMGIHHPLVDSLLQALRAAELEQDPGQAYTALRCMQLMARYMDEVSDLNKDVVNGSAWTQHAVPEVVVDPSEAPGGTGGITSPGRSPGRRTSRHFSNSTGPSGPMQFRWRPCSLQSLVEANAEPEGGKVSMTAILVSSYRVMQVLTSCVSLPSHLEQVSTGTSGLAVTQADAAAAALAGHRLCSESAEEAAFLCAVHARANATAWDENGTESVEIPQLPGWRKLWRQGARHSLQAMFLTSAQGSPMEQSSSSAVMALRYRWKAYTPEPLRIKSTWMPRVYVASDGYSTIFETLRAFSVLAARPAAQVLLSSPHGYSSPPLLTRETSTQSTVMDDGKSDKRAKVAAIAARDHAWQLLMQLPTSLQGSEALADPSVVDWPVLLADGGWNTLYTLQGVVAKLKDANSCKAGDGSQDAEKALAWRSSFLATGGLRSVLKRLVDFAGEKPAERAVTPPVAPGAAAGQVLPPPLPVQRQAPAAQSAITETKVQAQVTTLCLRVLRICSKFVSSDDLAVLQTGDNLGEHPAVVFAGTLVSLLGDITGQHPSGHSAALRRDRGDTSESLGLGGADTPVLGAVDLGGSTAGTLNTAASTVAKTSAQTQSGGPGDAASTEQSDTKRDSQMREALDILLLLMSIGSRFGEFGGSKSSTLLGSLLSKPAPAAILSCVLLRSDLAKVRASLQRSVFLSAGVLGSAAATQQCVAAIISTLAASDTLEPAHCEGLQALCQLCVTSAYGPTADPGGSIIGPAMHSLMGLVAFFKTAPTAGIRWPLIAALHACGHLCRELSSADSKALDQLRLDGGPQLLQLAEAVEPEGVARVRKGMESLQHLLGKSALPQDATLSVLLSFCLDVVLFTQPASTDLSNATSNWPLCVAAEERAAAYSLLRFVLLAGAKPALPGAYDDPHLFPSRGAQATASAQWFDAALQAVGQRTAGSGSPLDSDWAHELSLDVRGPNSYMGLVNPKGATCYANSVLQQLFMDRAFQTTLLGAQEASVPMLRSTLGLESEAPASPEEGGVAAPDQATEDAVEPEGAAVEEAAAEDTAGSKRRQWLQHRRLLIELQKTFKWLRASEHKAYNPSKLLETLNCLKLSFNVHEQNDAPEFFVKLIDHLERVTAGTAQGDALKRRFVGRVAQQITPFAEGAELRERPDKFTVLGVSVKSHPNLESALRTEFAPEMLYGANGVQLPSGDRCDAEKRDVITRLPEVLVVQLRRFQTTYTATGVDITKVNSRFAFPQILDMKPYTKWGVTEDRAAAELEAAVSEETPNPEVIAAAKQALREARQMAPPAGSENYKLAGVVVHTGTARGGHYYSFSKDDETGAWWELNDTFTSTFSERSLAREAFGGHEYVRMGLYDVTARPLKRNAVMLFYHRCEAGPLSAPGDSAAASGEGEESAPHLDDVDVGDETLCPSSMALVPTKQAHAALDAELTAMNQQAAEQIQRYDAQLMTFFGMLCKDLVNMSRAAVEAGPPAGASSKEFELGDIVPSVATPFQHSVLNECGVYATQLFLDVGMRCIDANTRTLVSLLAPSPFGAKSSLAAILKQGSTQTVQEVRSLLKGFPFNWLDELSAGDAENSPLRRAQPTSTLVSGLLDICSSSAPTADLIVRAFVCKPAASGSNGDIILASRMPAAQKLPMSDLQAERFLSPTVQEAAMDAPVPFNLPWWAMQRHTPEGVAVVPAVDAAQLAALQAYLARSPAWLQEGLLNCTVETSRARFARVLAAALAGSACAAPPPAKARVAAYMPSAGAPADSSVYPSPFLPASVRYLPAGCWWAPRTAFERDAARRQQLARFAALEARLKAQVALRLQDATKAQAKASAARAAFQPAHMQLTQLKEELHALEAPLEDAEVETHPVVVELRAELAALKQSSAQLRSAALKAVQVEGAARSLLVALEDWLLSVQELLQCWRFSVRHPESPAALAVMHWFSSALSACDHKCKFDAHEFFSLVPLLADVEDATHAEQLPAEADPHWKELCGAMVQHVHSRFAESAGAAGVDGHSDLQSRLNSLYVAQRHAMWDCAGQPRWLSAPLFQNKAPHGLSKFMASMNVDGSIVRLLPAVQDSARSSGGSHKTNTLRSMLQAAAVLTPLQPWSHPSAQHLFAADAYSSTKTHPLHDLLRALGPDGAFAAQVVSRGIAQSAVWQTRLHSAHLDEDTVLGVLSTDPTDAVHKPGLARDQLLAAAARVRSTTEGGVWAPILAEIVAGLPHAQQRAALIAVLQPVSVGGAGLMEFKEQPATLPGLPPAGLHAAESVCRFLYELCTPRMNAGGGDHACQSIHAELTAMLMRSVCKNSPAAYAAPECDLREVTEDASCHTQDCFMWDIAAKLQDQKLLVSPWAHLPQPDSPVLSVVQWMRRRGEGGDISAELPSVAWDWGNAAAKAVRMLSYTLIFKAADVHEDSKITKLSTAMYVANPTSGAGEYGQAAFYLRRTFYMRAQIMQELQFLRRLLIPRTVLATASGAAAQGVAPGQAKAALQSNLRPRLVRSLSMPGALAVKLPGTAVVQVSGAGTAYVNGPYVNYGGAKQFGAPLFKRRFAGQWITLARFRASNGTEPWYILRPKADGCNLRADIDFYVSHSAGPSPPSSPNQWQELSGSKLALGKAPGPSIAQVAGPPLFEQPRTHVPSGASATPGVPVQPASGAHGPSSIQAVTGISAEAPVDESDMDSDPFGEDNMTGAVSLADIIAQVAGVSGKTLEEAKAALVAANFEAEAAIMHLISEDDDEEEE